MLATPLSRRRLFTQTAGLAVLAGALTVARPALPPDESTVTIQVPVEKAAALRGFLAAMSDLQAAAGKPFADAVFRAICDMVQDDGPAFEDLSLDEARREIKRRMPPDVWAAGQRNLAAYWAQQRGVA